MRTLRPDEFEAMLSQGQVLEQDGHGIKVVRLADGRFLKTFWHRRLLSSRRLYPEWLRFVLHEKALKRRGVPTVTVMDTLRIPHLKRTAVIYQPLEGTTLRHLAGAGRFDAPLAGQLGGFVAALHRAGVHFHSLHLGNILSCPDGRLGLIDISNMRLFPWPLPVRTRERNLGHLIRDPQDLHALTRAGLTAFREGYLAEACSRGMEKLLTRALQRYDRV